MSIPDKFDLFQIGKKKIPKVLKKKKRVIKKRSYAETANVIHYLLSNYF